MPEPVPSSTAVTNAPTDNTPNSGQMSEEQLRDLAKMVYEIMLQDMRLDRERGS
jgi:hypothetical protein